MQWKPQQKWDWLQNETNDKIIWRKELHRDCLAFVCYFDQKKLGVIPLEYNRECEKHREWWCKTYDAHPDGIVLRQLMNEIANRANA